MLKGLSGVPNIEIVGMENAADYAARVYKNQYTAPTVLIFKYRYQQVKDAIQVRVGTILFKMVFSDTRSCAKSPRKRSTMTKLLKLRRFFRKSWNMETH